jgi:hypothetical protein
MVVISEKMRFIVVVCCLKFGAVSIKVLENLCLLVFGINIS